MAEVKYWPVCSKGGLALLLLFINFVHCTPLSNKAVGASARSVPVLSDAQRVVAEEFLVLVRQLQESRVYKILEGIRSQPFDSSDETVQFGDIESPSEQPNEAVTSVTISEDVDDQMNNETDNQWLESVISALAVDDLHKAEQFLLRFNDMHPNEQSGLVKMMLTKVQTKILQNPSITSEENSDPDIFIVENLIDIANKTSLAKNFEKAQDLLVKAVAIKQTPEAQKLLEQVQKDLENQQKVTCEKLIQSAIAAINDDDYDIAELLLQSTWIQYKNDQAKRMLEVFFENQIRRRTKNIECKTAEQKKVLSEKYVKIAEDLISEGQIKAAESILIIARNTDSSSNADTVLNEIHKSLYPNTFYSTDAQWKINFYSEPDPRWNPTFISVLIPTENINSYECYFYLNMAFREFNYADKLQIAEEFLMQAKMFYPGSEDIGQYLEEVANAKKNQV